MDAQQAHHPCAWMEHQLLEMYPNSSLQTFPLVHIHTANPIAKKAMEATLASIDKHHKVKLTTFYMCECGEFESRWNEREEYEKEAPDLPVPSGWMWVERINKFGNSYRLFCPACRKEKSLTSAQL